MADKKKMSVEEILAACRRNEGPGQAAASPPAHAAGETAPAEPAEPTAPESPKAAAKSPAPKSAEAGKKPSEMSVADILAAARGGKSSESASESAGDVPTEKPAKPKPAAAAGGGGGGKPAGGAMSVADILAAARAGKGAGAAAAAPKEKPAAKPATDKPATDKPATDKPATDKPATDKPATDKPATVKPAAAKGTDKAAAASAAVKDTSSILAAARKAAKPGPMSKAEAEAKGRPAEEKAKKKLEAPPMPVKPDYARPKAPAAQAETRRSFFGAVAGVFLGSSLAVGFSSLAVTHLLWVLGLARFMFPNVLTEPPTRFKVGTPDDYAPGYVENKYKAQFGVWVVRGEYEGQPQIYALQTVCTHLGCTPNWLDGEQKFKCPCHGSGFYKDGINFEGPAPRPLERFAIRLADDGQLEVDKSRKFQEELGQWKDPACFVPA